MAFAGSGRNRRVVPRRGRLTRRAFLGTAGVAGALLLRQGRALSYAANEQLQVAVVGLGGRGSGFAVEEGWSSVRQQTGGRIAALCDVNKKKAAPAFQRYPDVPKFEDFRVMIDQMGSKLDAVIVATPDHVHAAPSAYALRAGKHVFCEKGLTRTIQESRTLAELAFEKKRSTQMGNQAGYNDRVVENVWAGRLGEIQTIHMWGGGGAGPRPKPSGTHPVPDYLNWDLWLGPAAYRPYHPDWMKHAMWREFSCGHPGWWGAHLWATLFKTMKLETLWPIDKQAPAAGGKKGGWTFCIVNRGDAPFEADLIVPGGSSHLAMKRYVYSPDASPTDDNGFPVPAGEQTLDLAGGGRVACPADAVVLLTSL